MQSAQLQRQSKSSQGSRTTARAETVTWLIWPHLAGSAAPPCGKPVGADGLHTPPNQDSLQLGPASQWTRMPRQCSVLSQGISSSISLPYGRTTALTSIHQGHQPVPPISPPGALTWMPGTLASKTHCLRHSGATFLESRFWSKSHTNLKLASGLVNSADALS